MNRKDNDIKEKIIKGLDLTYLKLIRTKKERNLELVISDKGKIIWLQAKDC